jgi:hypothetical protein
MRAAPVVIAMLLLLPACEREPTPEEQAKADARDIAMVEAAQNRKPPLIPVQPGQITFGELQQNRMTGAGCAFLPNGGEDGNPVLYGDASRAVMKLNGDFEVFASDKGSAEQPYGTRAHYSGKAYDLRLTSEPGEGRPSGEESATWDAGITLRDRFNRIVYSANGTLSCGA